MAAKNSSSEISLTRVLDAPIQTVWDAWNDLEQVAQWWGPRGFSLTTHSKDLRPGGQWIYTMHGPDGTDFPSTTTYLEVQEPHTMVYDHGASGEGEPLFRVTVLFSEFGGKTKMDMTMALKSPEKAEAIRKHIRKVGGNSTWDRFAEYLIERGSRKATFVIARSFAAPLETMFKMWTDAEHFSQWLPPTGFTMRILRGEIRPGGSVFFAMTNGSETMYGRIKYLEIRRPDLIVYSQEFCDEKENISRHPMLPIWPAAMLSTVNLYEEQAGHTRVRVLWEPHGPATAAELEVFVRQRSSMTQGWTGSFDKLEELLGGENRTW
jgi:uncharacterized protein YndB with AHSA1/START domain